MSNCYDCGLEYNSDSWIETAIPDKIWRDISPTDNDGGILCISCIAKRLRQKGYKDLSPVPIWLCGTEPLQAMPGDPGDGANVVVLRTFDKEMIESVIEKEKRKREYFEVKEKTSSDFNENRRM